MDKVIAIVSSNKHYVLNFYECAFGLVFPGAHTLIYWDPYSPITEEFIHNKIEGAPTKLVVLVPDPDVPLSFYLTKYQKLNKNIKLMDKCNLLSLRVNTLVREDAEEEIKQECMLNSILSNFKFIQEVLDSKIIFKNGITVKKDDEDSEEEDSDME